MWLFVGDLLLVLCCPICYDWNYSHFLPIIKINSQLLTQESIHAVVLKPFLYHSINSATDLIESTVLVSWTRCEIIAKHVSQLFTSDFH